MFAEELAEKEKEIAKKYQAEMEKEIDAMNAKMELEIRKKEEELRTRFELEAKKNEEMRAQKFAEEMRKAEESLRSKMELELKKKEEELRTRSEIEIKKKEEELIKQMNTKLQEAEQNIRSKLELEFKKKEEDLRTKLELEFKAREQERERAMDIEIKKAETSIRSQIELEFKKREEEFRNKLEIEYRAKEERLEKKMEEELKSKENALRAQLELDFSKKVENIKENFELDYKRKQEGLEKAYQEKLDKKTEEMRKTIEAELKAKFMHKGAYGVLSKQIKKTPYPFTAIVGQENMKRALILNSINPKIGGVLIWGLEGNGKYTSILGLAHCLSDIKEQIITVDVAQGVVLKEWWEEDRYITGNIFAKNGQATYLIDTVLSTASLSIHTEKLDNSHPMVLVEHLKPEEEEILHIVNNMAIHVHVEPLKDVEQRIEVIKRVKEFNKDPEKFREKYQKDEEDLQNRIMKARNILPTVSISNKMMAVIARMCVLDKQGTQVDVLVDEIARTNAAFEGRDHVTQDDIMEAANMLLLHRFAGKKAQAEEEEAEEMP
jgi:magnesium chelatase subunit I